MGGLFDLPFEEPEPDPAVEPPARRVLTVSDLTADIRTLLETRFLQVWVEGEISNCRKWNTGHVYFTLKDSAAQIRAVMFRSDVRNLRFTPEDGLHVLVRGRITVYDTKGEYQIICEHMAPHGLGARQLAFEQLKRTLQAEGLFDAARKRPLPALPRKIGVVTSLDGAALRDIVKVLSRRYPNLHLVIRPARVQGEGAASELARGLGAIGRVSGVDVVILARGGGSIEDLWAFNEERVAKAIAACPVPVISAVGHETDVTIADYVADLRAPTPSAAAEIVVARKDEFCNRIDRLADRARMAVRSRLQRRRAQLHHAAGRPGLAGWPARLAVRGRHAAELSHGLARATRAGLARRERRYHALRLRLEARDLRRYLGVIRARLTNGETRLAAAFGRRQHAWESKLGVMAGRLESLSPLAVLARGYAVCWNADRTAIVRSANSVSPGDRVRVTLNEGELGCEIKDTKV
jgi:exodeoxyribonuclease VII large subunit